MALKNEILLGYEIKTAKPVKIKPSHLIVTGVTQLSGKTTTLETLIKRSGLKAIVFKTKIGERSFEALVSIQALPFISSSPSSVGVMDDRGPYYLPAPSACLHKQTEGDAGTGEK